MLRLGEGSVLDLGVRGLVRGPLGIGLGGLRGLCGGMRRFWRRV
jgi:hypothetical protein